MLPAQVLRSASSASASASLAALSRRRQEQQTRIRSVSSSSSSIPTTSTSSTSSAAAAPKPILILFDLDNAPIPSETPEIASAVVSVLARKMENLLRSDDGGGHPSSCSSRPFPVRAAAFANEATVRRRPGLPGALSSAGVSLVTVPSTKNAADAMVVSCAAGALSAGGSGSGSGSGGEGGRGGGGLSGLVFCSADNYISEFLRYASHKGVRTFVAGDFDNGRKKGGRGASGGGGGKRRARGGEKKSGSNSSGSESATASSSSCSDDDDVTTPPWRKKELPAAADGAALWSDVLSEARELLLLNR